MRINFNRVAGVVCVFLAACGAPEGDGLDVMSPEEVLLEQEAELDETAQVGTLEQHLDEAACGSVAVNRAVTFSGRNVRFSITPPYGSAACTNAFLTGLSSTTPRNGTVTIIGQLNVPSAQCPQARMRSHYFSNGSQVVQRLEKAGVFRNGSCLVSTSYNFNTARTVNSVPSADRALLAGGTPGAAATARFAAQAVNHLGQIQSFSWEINP